MEGIGGSFALSKTLASIKKGEITEVRNVPYSLAGGVTYILFYFYLLFIIRLLFSDPLSPLFFEEFFPKVWNEVLFSWGVYPPTLEKTPLFLGSFFRILEPQGFEAYKLKI
ncbi:hypothetical protein ACT7DP_15375 [Bacillus paranthracis]